MLLTTVASGGSIDTPIKNGSVYRQKGVPVQPSSSCRAAGGIVFALIIVAAMPGRAAPVTSTFAYIDSYSPGVFRATNNFAVGLVDETLSEGTGAPGEYTLTGHAHAYANASGGLYAIGALAGLDADFVPGTLIAAYGDPPVLWNTAEAMALGRIEDQLTFLAPALSPGATMNVSFTYLLGGQGADCDRAACTITGGVGGTIPATEVYGEARSSIGGGFQLQSKRIDFPAPGADFTHVFTVQNGATLAYTLELSARVFSSTADAKALGMDLNPGYFHIDATADYLSTLSLTGIAATDVSGTPLATFSITGSDGLPLAPVPLPGSAWLLGPAFAWLVRRRVKVRS